jgi:hypothetical protein
MLDLAYVRLLLRAFSVFWYGICAVAILFGLFELVLGLAAVLNLNLLGVKPADGPGFLALSLFTIAIAVGFFVLGRYFFRFVLLLLDRHRNEPNEEQFESLYSGATEEAADQQWGSADADKDDD